MRIAFVSIHDAEDSKQWSGIPYFILKEMRHKGIDVEVISPRRSPLRHLHIPQRIIGKLTGSSLQVDRRSIALRHFAKQINRRIRESSFDAVFSPSSIPISLLDVDVPIFYWTDAVIEGMSGYYSGSFARMSSRELRIAHNQEQCALDRATSAIFSSAWTAGIVKSAYRVSPDKVKVIEFGANLSVNHGISEIDRFNELRLKSDCVLLFIGVDWERKGGVLAFEAAKLLNERGIKTLLKVVGCEAPEAPFVERLGFISKTTESGRKQIERLFATSTFFVMPTRAEAAGIVFCEAAAFGLPVLTTETGGVESYVQHGKTGFCLPLAATGNAYADLVADTLANRETYLNLSMAAFERYMEKLNWSVAVSSLLSLVEDAARNLGHAGAHFSE